MKKIKTISSDKLLKKQLKNKDFAREYKKQEKEFKIAIEVIELRKRARMTQAELAQKAKTSQSAIARLESGEYHNLSLSFLRKVASALNKEAVVNFI
jgi:DNA-binding XRE family transcriptional regulator